MKTEGKLPISTSMMLDFLTCPMLFYCKHVIGRVPKVVSPSLRIGRAWHKAMETWWKGEPNHFLDAMKAFDDIEDGHEKHKLIAMLSGYHSRWKHEMDKYKIIGVEVPIEFPIVNPETGEEHPRAYGVGTIDKLVEEKGNGVIIVEHKTSGADTERGSDYWKRLALDTQISNYYLGAGREIKGCLYDVVSKPAVRPLKATPKEKQKRTKEGKLYAGQREQDESPEEYGNRIVAEITENVNEFYMRASIGRTDKQIENARFDLWYAANMIAAAIDSGEFPHNTRACSKIGGSLCEYFDPCAGQGSVMDNERYTDTQYKPGSQKPPKSGSKADPAVGF